MADLYDILNSGILNEYQPNKASLKINKPGIAGAVPNYNMNRIMNASGNLMRGAGILSTAVPFYKNIAFPIAQDMYKAILGDTDSKILQKALEMANVNNQQSTGIESEQLPGGLTTMPELDRKGESDLTKNSISNNKVSTSKQANAIANQVINNKSNERPLEGSVARVVSEDDINILNDYLKQLQDTTQPYIDSLERYKKNYFKNLDQARRSDLYFYGANLAKGLNPKAGEKFNPLQNQADIINTIKLIGDAKASQINAINELEGNMALVKEMDLPAKAAFGNKNLLTALSQAKKYATDLEKARIIDAMKRYGYDTSYNRAIDQQLLRNLGNRDVANIYMGGSTPGVGLQSSGAPVQQQTYSPIAQPQQDPRAQFFPNR